MILATDFIVGGDFASQEGDTDSWQLDYCDRCLVRLWIVNSQFQDQSFCDEGPGG
jgi:hypothetical protein